jgi:hypothetical protein
MKFFTCAVVDWLSTSLTKLVSLSAELDQCKPPEVNTMPEIPEFIGKLMNVFEYNFLSASCFSYGVYGVYAASLAY